jgi:hypothetical protein
MHEEDEVRRSALWSRADEGPTARQRTAVQHAVSRVLDALAPERPPARAGEPRGVVQRYRSPRGCVLQGDAAAVSVTWYPAGASDATLGELQVIAWDGVVSLPGAARRAPGGARPVVEELLRPVEAAADQWSWSAIDGVVLDTAAVVARCLHLLTPRPSPGDAPDAAVAAQA